jgi:hypothetical protein
MNRIQKDVSIGHYICFLIVFIVLLFSLIFLLSSYSEKAQGNSVSDEKMAEDGKAALPSSVYTC